jgi:hypothetical protein
MNTQLTQRPFEYQFRPRLHSRLGSYGTRFGLGVVLTPAQAEAQVVTPAQYTGAKMVQAEVDAIIQTATSGQLPFGPADFAAGWNCSGVQSGTAKIVTTAAGIGVSIGGSVAAMLMPLAVPIIGPIIAVAEALIGLFSAIFTHHAQAVAKEENVLCAAVPALNQALAALDAAVADGTLTPAAAIGTMQNVQQEFANAVSSIIKDDQSHCNAACVWTMCLAALALVRTSQWQQMEDVAATSQTSTPTVTPAQATTAVISGQGTATALPSWLPIAAGIALLFFVMK